MKRTCSCLLLCLLLMLCYVPFGRAQSTLGVDISLGFGTFRDSAIPTSSPIGGIYNEYGPGGDSLFAPNSDLAFTPCMPSAGEAFPANCQADTALGNVFMGFNGDLMMTNHFGFGFQVDFQPVLQNYGQGPAVGNLNTVNSAAPPLEYRQTFYDFDGIWAPFSSKRLSLRLLGGIGGAHTGFSFPVCSDTAICGNESEPFSSVNHFQIHAGVGLRILITDHIFVEPEVDYRYVPNLNTEFNSDSVGGAMVWVGYSFGGS